MKFSKEKIIVAYTLEICTLCKLERKRKFEKGDFLFSKNSKCNSCDGMMFIEKIFGEEMEK